MKEVVITGLHSYPVKSLAGLQLTAAQLEPSGVLGDREWMIVDSEMRFQTQRQLPSLARIVAVPQPDGHLVLRCGSSMDVSVHPDKCCTPVTAQIWKDTCAGFMAPKPISQWLTEHAESKNDLHLIYFDKNQRRPVNAQRFGSYHTYFADAAPFLVCNERSLQAVNEALTQQQCSEVDIRRFRPSIVIEGIDAFTEHQYRELHQPEKNITVGLRDHCQRCAVITVNQSTGKRANGGALLKTIASLNPMPNQPKAPAFGVNAVLLTGSGQQLAVGDRCLIS